MEVYLHSGMQAHRYRRTFRFHIGDYLMDLFLQFGYGMMDHSRSLINEWGGGTTVLSPRDLNDGQLVRLAGDLGRSGGNVLVDPQFYLPDSDHQRLCAHEYWPGQYESVLFWSGPELANLLRKLVDLNQRLGTSKIILPGRYAAQVDDSWLAQQRAFVEEAERMGLDPTQLLATVALSGDAARNEAQIHTLLEESQAWPVGGVYLICEHPRGDYLVEDPNWLANVLDLIAGYRLRGKEVIVGYCNQQMLICACASASAICSGTWMNVRSFPPDKFKTQYEEEIKQRTTWYYCPQALSEFKIPFLDIANRQGILDEMAPLSEFGSTYVAPLFSGIQPTTAVGFGERDAFRHFLHCIRSQAAAARKDSYDATVDAHNKMLDEAERLLNRFHSFQVRGQKRDFASAIDANRAALSVLDSTRGPILRRNWSRL